jgi:DNA repair protein RecO (recombination protein O)
LLHNGAVRTFKTEGIIIKRRNFGEADRILTVLTPNYGKLQIKASGVRRITSRRSAHVELLNNAQLGLYKGNGFPILTEARMIEDFSSLKNDFNKIGLAYHLCELVDGLCPDNQEQREVYELLKKTLHALCYSAAATFDVEQREESPLPVLIHDFEVELLSLLGYWNKQEETPFVLRDAPIASNATSAYIESIIERRLKSRKIFSKLQ